MTVIFKFLKKNWRQQTNKYMTNSHMSNIQRARYKEIFKNNKTEKNDLLKTIQKNIMRIQETDQSIV